MDELGLDNVFFRVSDARASGTAAGSFDVVVAADLFEHLYPDDSEAATAEAFRLLRPGSRIAVWPPGEGPSFIGLPTADYSVRNPEGAAVVALGTCFRPSPGGGSRGPQV